MLKGFERHLQKQSKIKYFLLLAAVAVIKTGLSPIGKEWVAWVFDAAEKFPKSASYISYSLGPTLLAKNDLLRSIYMWWGLSSILLIAWTIWVYVRLARIFPSEFKIFQIIFFSSPLLVVNLSMIGHYDLLSSIGGSLVWLSTSLRIASLGAFIAGAANPYMSFAVGVCILFLYIGTRIKYHLEVAFVWLMISLCYLIGTHLIFQNPNSGTRESIVLGQIGFVVKGSLSFWNYILLSVLGSLSFLFLLIICQEKFTFGAINWYRRISIILGIFFIPFAMSFFILDHTRIGVIVSSVPLMIFLMSELPSYIEGIRSKVQNPPPILAIIFLFWLCTPTFMVDSGGKFRLPYAKLLNQFFGW